VLDLQFLDESFLLIKDVILLVQHSLESLDGLLGGTSHFRSVLVVLGEHLVSVLVDGVLDSLVLVAEVLVVGVPSFHSLDLGFHTMDLLMKVAVLFLQSVDLTDHFRVGVRGTDSCVSCLLSETTSHALAEAAIEVARILWCSSIE
jgi:hypothetical protein